jgi:hypothetical protein
MAAGGLALAAPLVGATKAAMELETALTRVKTMTGASDSQMRMLNDTFTKTANLTGIFSKPKIATFAAEMFTSGIRDPNQINALLPGFAKAADALYLDSHGKQSASDTVHSLVALAHQFGYYTPDKMQPISEAAFAMSRSLPGGIKSLASTGASVNVIGNRNLGIDPVELMAFQAAVAQTSGSKGAGGKGRLSASNQINALVRALPGMLGNGLITGSSGFSAATLGLADKYGASTIMKGGKLDFAAYQKKMADFEKLSSLEIAKRMMSHVGMLSKKKAIDIYPIIERAIATQGKGVDKQQLLSKLMSFQFGSASSVAMLLGDPAFISVMQKMKQAAKESQKTGGIDKAQEAYMKTLEGQLQRLGTNWNTLSSTIGSHLIPVITPLLTKFNDFLDTLNTFASANPRLVQMATSMLAVASGLLIFGGIIQMVHAGFMGLQFVLPVMLRGLGPLGLAITAVGLAVANWDKIMEFVHKNQKVFIHIAALVARAIDLLGQAFNKFLGVVRRVAVQLGGFISSIPGMQSLGAGITNGVAGLFTPGEKVSAEDVAFLRAHGMGDLVAAISGVTVKKGDAKMPGLKAAFAEALKSAKPAQKAPVTVNQKMETHLTINAAPGTDTKAIEGVVKSAQANFIKDALRLAGAASGNSAGRTLLAGGGGRP